MRKQYLIAKYEPQWHAVYDSVFEDMRGDSLPAKDKARIAHNAAFEACYSFHKFITASRKKNIVAGKTSNNSNYAAALRDIRNLVNCTDFAMTKYSKIAEICQRLNASTHFA
jgi:hypothetical protein